jgi:hypothetical protein
VQRRRSRLRNGQHDGNAAALSIAMNVDVKRELRNDIHTATTFAAGVFRQSRPPLKAASGIVQIEADMMVSPVYFDTQRTRRVACGVREQFAHNQLRCVVVIPRAPMSA